MTYNFDVVSIKYDIEGTVHKIYKNGLVVDTFDDRKTTKPIHENEKTNCFVCEEKTNGFMCKKCNTENENLRKFRKRLISYIKCGEKNVSCLNSIKDKKKHVCMEKYGVENPSHLPEIQNKIREKQKNEETISKRIEKTKKTVMDRYGVEHYSQTLEFKEKYKQTSVEKYGTAHVLKSDVVRKKYKQTVFEKYNVENPMQNEDIKRKSINKSWKTRHINKYGAELDSFRDGWRNSYFEGGFQKALLDYPMISALAGCRNFLDETERVKYLGGSETEIMFRTQIESILKNKFELNVRSVIENNKQLEIDMLDRKNNISIEFNGYYWHQVVSDLYEKDLYKAETMRKNGWTHVSLDESDWYRIDKISNLLINKTPIYARKLKIEQISNESYRLFCVDNHLDGYAIAKHRFALVDVDGNIMQIMSFSKDRFGKCDYEIIRLVTKAGYVIIGGSERLFKHAIKELGNPTIVSYSNNKFFSGNVYKKLGFEFVGNTKPNYIWSKANLVYKRYDTMKHKLSKIIDNFDPNKTETENMVENGFIKIKDLGNKKWVYINE